MVGRISLIAGMGAVGLAHVMHVMPSRAEWRALLLGAALLGVLIWFCTRRLRFMLPVGLFVLSLLWVTGQIEQRQSERLATPDEDAVSRVVLRVSALVRLYPGSRQFEAQVLESRPSGIPQHILVSWHTPGYNGPYREREERDGDFPELVPGQVWRMSLNLRTPHAVRNPHGFDYEGHLFAQGLRAVGSVRGTPHYLHDDPWHSLPVVAQRARHVVRKAMAPYIQDYHYGAVLLALAIGDQASVAAQDWTVFNRTSITHLVSISGSHITMIAALAGWAALWLWKRLRWRGVALTEHMPAQIAACLAALLAAWLYCLLAGWGVPARRTFMMLSVVAVVYLLRLPIGPWRVLVLAAAAVVVMDPWALMASGFWLSFGAVAVLLTSPGWLGRLAPARKLSTRQRILHWLWQACLLQLTVTAALMPVLAWLFHEISLVSPLANAYAIPVISLIVTPLSLLLASAALVPGLDGLAQALAWLAHGALYLMMQPTVWLAQLPLASMDAAAAPLGVLIISLAGLAVAIMPRGLPARHAGWLLMLPALLWRPERADQGGWNMLALDVGQGAAVLVQTQNHALLFDTGIRASPTSDAASRYVLPLLRAKGVKQLDVLIVSHADIDHAGGLRSLLQGRPIGQVYSSFDIPAYLRREAAMLGLSAEPASLPSVFSACHYGAVWRVDGVTFEFLWPLASVSQHKSSKTASQERNAQSCVLRIRGRYHTALLTGDIFAAQEKQLVQRGLGKVDVVLAAHHGSRTSSSGDFVMQTAPAHVIAQTGRWNRYGHPHPTIERRWTRAGAQFWRTDLHGAISLRSGSDGLRVQAQRQVQARSWDVSILAP